MSATDPSTQGVGSSSTAQKAGDAARDVASSARDAGQHVAAEAKAQAGGLAQEAQDQVRQLWGETRGQLSAQLSEQNGRLGSGIRTFGQDLQGMADGAESSTAATIVRELGSQASRVGSWFEDRGPEGVLEDVRDFARRRPGTFLLTAAVAGVVVGRLARGLKDAGSSSSSSAPSLPSGQAQPSAAPLTGTAGVPGEADPLGTAGASPVGLGDPAASTWTPAPVESGASGTDPIVVPGRPASESAYDDGLGGTGVQR
ncbi:hypothetical protein [Cellulomonas massiliensis]|uniref:hypothetical protein n=1 Tax=Cellulomonas massiliensis TaxID=1465811 RepID=UPI000313E4D4|nr:hypothetical protein [Cellulomonas massiliensis]